MIIEADALIEQSSQVNKQTTVESSSKRPPNGRRFWFEADNVAIWWTVYGCTRSEQISVITVVLRF